MNNKKLLKGILTAIILLEMAFCLLYYFGLNDIRDKNNNIYVLKNNLSSQVEKQRYMSSMEQMIENTDTNITKINTSIIQKGEDVKFIEEIEGIAKDNNLIINIDSLSVEENTSFVSSGLAILKVKANMSGGWAGVYSFLSQIESMPFRIKIDKFALISNVDQVMVGTKSANSKQWQGIFEISVLKYK
jgi:hypothetical protein